eukprot:scaffold71013_cov26-Tisochrysis_lutea.AAC.2
MRWAHRLRRLGPRELGDEGSRVLELLDVAEPDVGGGASGRALLDDHDIVGCGRHGLAPKMFRLIGQPLI